MSENEKKECKCICQSEAVRKIAVIAVGTFIGVFCSLSLFSALNRPHFVPHHHFCPCQMHQFHQMPPKFHKGDFKGMPQKNLKGGPEAPKGDFQPDMS